MKRSVDDLLADACTAPPASTGTFVVDDVSFSIDAGQSFVLLSGSGQERRSMYAAVDADGVSPRASSRLVERAQQ